MPEVRNAKITNGIAEGFNNTMKTIIKISYEYNNFDRFRRRALIISQKNGNNRFGDAVPKPLGFIDLKNKNRNKKRKNFLLFLFYI